MLYILIICFSFFSTATVIQTDSDNKQTEILMITLFQAAKQHYLVGVY